MADPVEDVERGGRTNFPGLRDSAVTGALSAAGELAQDHFGSPTSRTKAANRESPRIGAQRGSR